MNEPKRKDPITLAAEFYPYPNPQLLGVTAMRVEMEREAFIKGWKAAADEFRQIMLSQMLLQNKLKYLEDRLKELEGEK